MGRATIFAAWGALALLTTASHAQTGCETIKDQRTRNACFAGAGVPVIDCAQPRDADEAAFCRSLPAARPAPTVSAPSSPPLYTHGRCQGPGGLDIGDYAWVPNPTPQDIANGGWEVCPGKVVMPATYCRWAGQVLPQAQEQTCYAMHLKANPADFKPIWKRFEADNGAAFALEMNNIDHLDGCGRCADAVICVLDNNQCLPPNARRIRFDCHGHYMDVLGGGSMQIAPPRSVIGQMAAIACKTTTTAPVASTQSAPPSSLQGCTQERAAEIAGMRTLQSGNDPCLVHWRAIEVVQKHPERAAFLECSGLKAYENPQPPGHPISLEECDRIARDDAKRYGLSPKGLSDEQKASYRATWGQ